MGARRAILGALLGDEAVEALLSDDAQITAMLDFERALASAQAELGVIPEAAPAAIRSAIDQFKPDWALLAEGMKRDGVVVPELIRQLREGVGAEFASFVHLGATSQDAVDTALALQLAKVIPIFVDRIAALLEALDSLDARYGSLTYTAHTRMQAAIPTTVTAKIRSWSQPLARHRAALLDLRPRILVIQLGGPVGDRASFGADGEKIARHLADSLGLGYVTPWQTEREELAMFGARIATLAGSLGKIGADVALLAQSEIGTIVLAGGGTSSAMPHKNNPIAAEVLVANAHRCASLSASMVSATVHENERSGSAWTLEWLTLPDLIVSAGASLIVAQRLLDQISFVPPR